MGASLLQLASYGNENIYLNGNPQITYFKMVFKRYTNFASQTIKIYPETTPDILPDSKNTVTFKIKRHADLMGDTYLVVDIPDIYTFCPTYDTSTDEERLKAEFFKLRWNRNLGFNLIHSIDLFIGGNSIDKQYGEWLYIWNELFLPQKKKDLLNEMIGNTPDMYDPKYFLQGKTYEFETNWEHTMYNESTTNNVNTYSGDFGSRIVTDVIGGPQEKIARYYTDIKIPYIYPRSDAKNAQSASIREFNILDDQDLETISSKKYELYTNYVNRPPAIMGKKLYIPLNFWFGKNSGLFIPLIALQYHEIEIKVEFERLNKLFTVESSYSDYWNLYTSNQKRGAKPLGSQGNMNFGNFTINAQNRLITNAYLEINYVFLDKPERDIFAKKSHEYLIEQVKRFDEPGLSISNINLNLNHLFHPVKYLVFVAQKRKYYDKNQLNNYTNWEEFHYTTFNDNSQNPIYDISQSNDLFRQMYFILYRNGGGDSANLVDNDANDSLVTGFSNHGQIVNGTLVGKHQQSDIRRDNFKSYKKYIIENIALQFNGIDRLSFNTAEYFNLVQKFQHDVNFSPGIYIYSFSLHPNKFEPSGSCNMSQINNITLKLQFDSELSGDEDNAVDFRLYTVNYNILKFKSGMANLVFAN